jgi:hypothetical protein
MSLFDRDNPVHRGYYEMWGRRLAGQKKPWIPPAVRKIEWPADVDFSPENEA